MERNPALLQNAPLFKQDNAPLVLIHDGGGTTFGYHCLPSLQRTVYAIHNPHFYSGRPWPGGIPAMARIYIELIRSRIPAGEFILGGWSFGGLVSLEIASILSREDTGLTVMGLIMMDSIYPGSVKRHMSNAAPNKSLFGVRCRPEISMLCSAMMKQSAKMAEQWKVPTWPPTENNSTYLIHDGSEFELGYDEKILQLPRPPRTVLLRCQEKVPLSPNPSGGEMVSRVDAARDRSHLGWEDYDPNLITAVLDVPGHHFSLFSPEKITATAAQLYIACELLEAPIASTVR